MTLIMLCGGGRGKVVDVVDVVDGGRFSVGEYLRRVFLYMAE